jgi:hypothetical protein
MITTTLLLAAISSNAWLNIGMTVGTVLGGISIGFLIKKLKTWVAKRKDAETREEQLGEDSTALLTNGKNHQEINEVLNELRNVLSAERAQVGQFHNGGDYLDGSPVKRFSVSYESFRSGSQPMAPQMQGVLLSLFWDVVPVLRDNKAVGRLVAEQDEGYFRSLLENGTVYAFAALPLRKWHAKSKKSQIIGYVLVEWGTQEDYEAQSDSHIRSQLRSTRTVIESQLAR